MKVLLRMVLSIIFLSILWGKGISQNKDYQKDYIQKYSNICILEMQRTAIPASIKMAQAILESSFGKSELAQNSNNHFGIKCSTGWDGKTYYVIDDEVDENFQKKQSCFRSYGNPEESFIAHSDFLTDPKKEKRYGFLFSFGSTDYRSWAYGLRQAGYASNPNYGDLLIKVIEDYSLHTLDVSTTVANPPTTTPSTQPKERTIQMLNDVKMVLAFEGETISEIAAKYDLSGDKIVEYNDYHYRGGEKLKSGTKIFLQRKRRFYRGRQADHFFKNGETMFDIAQMYGIRLYRLYDKNRLPEGSKPVEGSKISLRGFVSKKNIPKIMSVNPNDNNMSNPKSIYDDEAPGFPNALNGELLDFEITGVKEKMVKQSKQDQTTKVETTKPVEAAPTTKKVDKKVEEIKTEVKIVEEKPVVASKEITETKTKDTVVTNTKIIPKVEEKKIETKQPPAVEKSNEQFHTVIKGDTAYNISKKYNITIEQLKKLNNLIDLNIKLGQKLRVK